MSVIFFENVHSASALEEKTITNSLTDSIQLKLLEKLNEFRKQMHLDALEIHQILFKTAEIQARFMAESGKAT